MSTIKVIAIGKKHESWITEGIDRYSKRLRTPWSLEWVLLPHSAREGIAARSEETERIMNKLNDRDYVMLLDERGKLLDSPTLSRHLEDAQQSARQIVLIIGGAYGVDEALTARADLVWSLSPLVFPHQLVRLILAEQLYRAQEIALGNPYHHE